MDGRPDGRTVQSAPGSCGSTWSRNYKLSCLGHACRAAAAARQPWAPGPVQALVTVQVLVPVRALVTVPVQVVVVPARVVVPVLVPWR